MRAWKIQQVYLEPDGHVVFSGYGGAVYGVEAVARCGRSRLYPHKDHPAPDENCSCGFYGLKDKPDYTPAPGHGLLEVEFYGKVIPHEKGYRAEKMRVLSVTTTPACHECRDVATFKNRAGTPLCAVHALDSRSRFFEWSPEPVNCETEWRWAT